MQGDGIMGLKCFLLFLFLMNSGGKKRNGAGWRRRYGVYRSLMRKPSNLCTKIFSNFGQLRNTNKTMLIDNDHRIFN